MPWYRYATLFLGGVFLSNFLPHFANGTSGRSFPSPFGDPPGIGHSSPLTNVLWGSANLLLAYGLLRFGRLSPQRRATVLVAFLGVVANAVVLSQAFG